MLKFLTKKQNKSNKQNKKLLFFPLKSTLVKILGNKPIFNDPFFLDFDDPI